MLLRVANKSARNSGINASSRTLFAVAQTYGNSYMKAMFGRANDGGAPMAAFICSFFGVFALARLANKSFNEVRLNRT